MLPAINLPAINLEFYGYLSAVLSSSAYLLIWREPAPMLELFLMRTVLRAISTVLGGFGVFYLILSWSAPTLWGIGLVLIGAASGITYCLDR